MTQRLLAGSLALGLVLAAMIVTASPASACEYDGEGGMDGVLIAGYCESHGETDSGAEPASGSDATEQYASYVWASVCGQFAATGNPSPQYLDCAAARSCTNPDERVWQLWGERLPRGSGWDLLGARCFGVAEPPESVTPTVTPGMVLEAIRRIGLPSLEAKTQPAGKTLVNFETIFYAEPQTFSRSLTLLGQQIAVEAWPVEYRWHHGDGTVATTTSPGAPYPAKEITYSYIDAHVTVDTRVDVTYAARFRVNGGAWQDIGETVTIVGPPSALRIAEAVPVLSGDYS